MEDLPNFGLANTVTGFATLFSGCLPLVLTYLMGRQPARWIFVYWTILVTGIFTITLHGYGETNPIWGERWFWGFLDTGSNIVVTWAVAMAILGDYYGRKTIRWAIPLCTIAMLIGIGWHFYERMPGTPRYYAIPLGEWGGFHPGEAWLIAYSWLGVGLLVAKRKLIRADAWRLLLVTWGIFFLGMLLATASNDKILPPFIPLHALWHLVSAYGFIVLWAFNHVRFYQGPLAESEGAIE